ncbi:MAG TPA: hypothetical protein VEC57_08800 [Candidatus Limnocylindrales bacterium]|nr:hypothetical protein [Candidatus Limnocylindrales bacterium]
MTLTARRALRSILNVAVTVPVLTAAPAFAADDGCRFNVVTRDKGVKASLIRAFAACPSTENTGGYNNPNTETTTGVPACSPVAPPWDETGQGQGSRYEFSDRGMCSLQMRGAIVADCGVLTDDDGFPLGLPAGPCHVTRVSSRCSGIVTIQDQALIDGNDHAGWSLHVVTRATINDSANGDMTVIDLPVRYLYDTPAEGEIELSGNSAEALLPIVGPALAALPTCSQLQPVVVRVMDPDGAPFAVPGVGTHGKADLE